MEVWLWAVICILLITITAMSIKIYLLQKSAREITEAFAERLITESNTLIDISSNDRYMRRLAATVNVQLDKLCRERHLYTQGDLELKNAVTNISHDLRTPLTAISGYLDLLDNIEKDETVERYLSIIKDRTEILKNLTEELFRYSVITSVEYYSEIESVTVNGVLEESISAFYAALNERGITPDIHITDKRIVRNLNRAALSRIFSNLLNNAIKYSEGDLSITLADDGKIIFSNTASSLSQVEVKRLFERFYTVKNAKNGTGLGLSIARILAEQMNAEIYAEYDNRQLRICLCLPEAS